MERRRGLVLKDLIVPGVVIVAVGYLAIECHRNTPVDPSRPLQGTSYGSGDTTLRVDNDGVSIQTLQGCYLLPSDYYPYPPRLGYRSSHITDLVGKGYSDVSYCLVPEQNK